MPEPLPCGSSFPADVNAPRQIPITVPLAPWLFDHQFNGQAIFPAVELMRLLACSVHQYEPSTEVSTLQDARFNRLLALPAGQAQMELIIDLSRDNDSIRAGLFSRQQLKTMTRLVQHGEISFGGGIRAEDEAVLREPGATEREGVAIEAELIYRELVPFGPAFRTLQGKVTLLGAKARGTLRAPDFAHETEPLGSPFPLDGAMHAACVHGQRQADFVPFPVGFAARVIHRPTVSGRQYQTCATLRQQAPQELVYDLEIRDMANCLCETIRQLRMRDVTGGRMKPPAWIKALGKAEAR